MPTLSFSSCSRACTPAWERAMIRWRFTYPTRVACGACASAGVGTHHRAERPASTPAATAACLKRRLMPLSFWLERRAHRKLEIAELFPALRVRVDAVVHPEGPKGRIPAEPGTDRVLEVRQVDRRVNALVGAVDVADVEKERRPDSERQGHRILEVAQHLEIPADARAGRVLRRDLARLETPDAVRAAEVVALEERHRVFVPAQLVTRQEASAEHMV